jgi:hypothetical protein
MERSIMLIVFLLSLGGCIVLPGETHLPVEYAELRTDSKSMRQAVEYLESLLAARGFRSDGIYLERRDAAEIRHSYRGPQDSFASIEAEDGCISFTTYVKEGTYNYAAPRSLFNEVVSQLERDGAWNIKRDQICR